MKKTLLTTYSLQAVLLLAIMAVWQVQPVFSAPGQTAQQPNPDSLALENADWQILYTADGIELKTVNCTMFGAAQNISVLAINPKYANMAVAVTDTLTTTSRMAMAHNADFAVNGSFFDFAGPALTFVKTHHTTRGNAAPEQRHRKNWGVFAVKGSGIGITQVSLDKMEDISRKYTYVMASYPMLLAGGRNILCQIDSVPSKFNNRNPRSLIGKTREGVIYIVTIDGRAEGKAAGMTLAEECLTAKWLGLYCALNLDGGGSTTLWARQLGIINCPSDNKRFDHDGERRVSNIIYVCERKRR